MTPREGTTMEFALPAIGEGVYEAELVRWLVGPGEAVKPGQVLLEVLTDKATMEVPAPFAGTVTALAAEPGDILKIGQNLLAYTPAEQAAPVPTAGERRGVSPPVSEPQLLPALPGRNTNGPAPTPLSVRAAPSVRHMARKLGIDLSTVSGTGPDGRILLDDLSQFLNARGTPGRDMPPQKPVPRFDYGTPGSRVKLAGLRRRIAEHMKLSKSTIPHYSYVDECDVTELVRLRTNLKDVYRRAGVKLTYLAFFVKAAVAALREVPLVNATLDESAGEIILHDRYHIGIAVATPAGLIVPVVRDADKKDIGTIAREIDRLSTDARANRPRPEDLRGSTFTITSVGNLGGLISTPVINHPEVAILGIGKVVRRPVFDDAGQIRAAEIVYLSLSFDHRVVDGAVGAVFGNAILKQLQNPAALLLPEKL